MKRDYNANINFGCIFKINLNKNGISYILKLNDKVDSSKMKKDNSYKNANITNNSKDDDILIQINYLRTINTFANICIVSLFLLPIGILLKILLFRHWKISLNFEMDDLNQKKFNYLNDFLLKLSNNNVIWQIRSLTEVNNIKYNAGASSNVTRKKIKILKQIPRYISSNIDIFSLRLKQKRIYFLPDRILIFAPYGEVFSKKYSDLSINFSFVDFIETGFLPADSEIIKYTWQYVNVNGAPDKRFKDNRRMAVCKYGVIKLKLHGMNEICLYCSNHRLINGSKKLFETFYSYYKQIIDELIVLSNITEKSCNLINKKTKKQFLKEKSKGKKCKIINIWNVVSYVVLGFSIFIILGCVLEKLYIPMLLWGIELILLIPKINAIIIFKYPKYTKKLILMKCILFFVAFIVLGLSLN